MGLGASLGEAQNAATNPMGVNVRPKRDPSLIEVEDVAGLPRVLLIGDSISMGYTLAVREKLKGRANVHHPNENCGDTTRGLKDLDKWLGSGHWDVIHFNFGLHDLKYLDDKGQLAPPEKGKQVASPDQYGQHLEEIATRLLKTGAKVIFATTTPAPPGTVGRVAGSQQAYNQVALAVMEKAKIPVDDLGGYVAAQQRELPPRPLSELPAAGRRATPRPGEIQLPFNVHFTPDGYQKLADQVVTTILPLLPAAEKKAPAQ